MSFDLTMILVGLALVFAGLVKGASGMGFPMIATPTVALLLDIRIAITILIIPNIVMDVAQAFRGGVPFEVLRRFAWFFLVTIIGVFLGTKLLVTLPLWVLNLCLGVMVLVFVISNWLRFEFTIPPRLEGILALPAGFISGFLNGMTNAAGPALAIYLYSLKLPKMEFIKSIATIFIITKLSQLVAVSTWNLFNWSTLSLSLKITLFVLLGFYGGLKIQDRVNQKTFSHGLLILLFVIGVTLVLRGLTQRA
ncbi:MAG TPA: sulfite exporter TauE/SafE family protein [Candidatus Binatia bacterium]|nr:sulfite exporter TauE/SafE family protein [Candidatus Binatia bacterium]